MGLSQNIPRGENMIDYATIANTSGAYPNVVGLNVTAPGAGDGTPWIKAYIDDSFGAAQALMNHAGMTPDAVTESATASQRLEALQKVAGFPGEVVSWMGDAVDPSALGVRLLPLNGQGILRASYGDLDTYTYVGNSDNPTASAFYHADDAAGTIRNTAGIYLILPDLRGYIIRGLDIAGAVDPRGADGGPGGGPRDIGNVQAYAVKTHRHVIRRNDSPGTVLMYFNYTADPGAVTIPAFNWPTGVNTLIAYETGMSQANLSASESRMVNITARWCIRY